MGTQTGDVLRFTSGPNHGEYHVAAIVGKNIVLDFAEPIVSPFGTDVQVMITGRGTTLVVEDAKLKVAKLVDLPMATLAAVPEGTRVGDYLRYDASGQTLWWGIKGVIGRTLVLDRPLVDPRDGAAQLPASIRVEVHKKSLPPYALIAMIIAGTLAVVLTLIETYAPANVRAWVPSATGLGLGFVVAGFDSISMFLGSLLAWGFQKIRPKLAEEYTVSGASGIMAGGSLAGILIIVLSKVWSVFAVP
jgi:hypothetical protein